MPADQVAKTTDKGHGRIEVRALRVIPLLTMADRFDGLKRGFRLTRVRTVGGVTTEETAWGVTSLGPEAADAAALLRLSRGHWGIENGLHYRRDVTLAEDASRIRCGAAPEVMAALRNGVIHAAQATEKDSLPTFLRTMANCFEKALAFLGLSLPAP